MECAWNGDLQNGALGVNEVALVGGHRDRRRRRPDVCPLPCHSFLPRTEKVEAPWSSSPAMDAVTCSKRARSMPTFTSARLDAMLSPALIAASASTVVSFEHSRTYMMCRFFGEPMIRKTLTRVWSIITPNGSFNLF